MNKRNLPHTIVAVFVFIQRGKSILLVRQNYGHQFWSLPGGVMEKGETIEQAAIREVREETGLDIHLGRLIGVYSKPSEAAIALTFAGVVTGGNLKADHEVMQVDYFPINKLPENIRDHLRQRIDDFEANLTSAVIRTQ
jgi:8-oxo-dGTP diphosphatase